MTWPRLASDKLPAAESRDPRRTTRSATHH
jgi:hypothetical protein